MGIQIGGKYHLIKTIPLSLDVDSSKGFHSLDYGLGNNFDLTYEIHTTRTNLRIPRVLLPNKLLKTVLHRSPPMTWFFGH